MENTCGPCLEGYENSAEPGFGNSVCSRVQCSIPAVANASPAAPGPVDWGSSVRINCFPGFVTGVLWTLGGGPGAERRRALALRQTARAARRGPAPRQAPGCEFVDPFLTYIRTLYLVNQILGNKKISN